MSNADTIREARTEASRACAVVAVYIANPNTPPANVHRALGVLQAAVNRLCGEPDAAPRVRLDDVFAVPATGPVAASVA